MGIDLLVANIAIGPADPATFDVTNDGRVDLADCDQWLALAGARNLPSGSPYLLGDANLDGVVDGTDFSAWNNNKFTSTAARCRVPGAAPPTDIEPLRAANQNGQPFRHCSRLSPGG